VVEKHWSDHRNIGQNRDPDRRDPSRGIQVLSFGKDPTRQERCQANRKDVDHHTRNDLIDSEPDGEPRQQRAEKCADDHCTGNTRERAKSAR
jgi:hypothetical protein